MSESSEVQTGKGIVTTMLMEVAADLGLTVSEVGWGKGTGDFDNSRFSLAFRTTDGKRHLIRFSIEDLEDVSGDKTVRGELRVRVRERLQQLVPRSRRIGL